MPCGARIQVELTLRTDMDAWCLRIDDPRPAGFEPTRASSRSRFLDGCWVREEIRDDRTIMLVDHIAPGDTVLTHTLRAEAPGHFHAPPTTVEAMYEPDITANSDPADVTIS